MYLIYSAVAIAEVFVLLGSAIGVVFLVVRAIIRALFAAKDETQRVPTEEEMQHHKRADSRMPG